MRKKAKIIYYLLTLQRDTLFGEIMATGKVHLYKYVEEHIFPNSTLNRDVYLIETFDKKLTTLYNPLKSF